MVALGRCDHPICYRCSVRMRALCGVRYCAVCREELGQVRPGPAPSYPAGPGLFPPPPALRNHHHHHHPRPTTSPGAGLGPAAVGKQGRGVGGEGRGVGRGRSRATEQLVKSAEGSRGGCGGKTVPQPGAFRVYLPSASLPEVWLTCRGEGRRVGKKIGRKWDLKGMGFCFLNQRSLLCGVGITWSRMTLSSCQIPDLVLSLWENILCILPGLAHALRYSTPCCICLRFR